VGPVRVYGLPALFHMASESMMPVTLVEACPEPTKNAPLNRIAEIKTKQANAFKFHIGFNLKNPRFKTIQKTRFLAANLKGATYI